MSEQDGKLILEQPPHKSELGDDMKPVPPEQVTVDEVIAKHEKSPSDSTDEPKKKYKIYNPQSTIRRALR